MANKLVRGLVAGAAGTVALNVVGYLDMLARGRPASDLPARVAGRLADEVGIPLDWDDDEDEAGGGEGADDDGADDRAGSFGNGRLANRQEALGALLGYANGLGLGGAYGIVRLVMPRPPTWLAGALLGGAAMAASDIPATSLELTDPQEWGTQGWLSDIAPHLAYGLVTAWTFEALGR
jgi:hypothetical protein